MDTIKPPDKLSTPWAMDNGRVVTDKHINEIVNEELKEAEQIKDIHAKIDKVSEILSWDEQIEAWAKQADEIEERIKNGEVISVVDRMRPYSMIFHINVMKNDAEDRWTRI